MQQDSRLPVPAAGDGGAPLVPFFREISSPLVTAARRLRVVVSDPAQRDAGCAEIKGIEAAADALARAAVARLFSRATGDSDFLSPLTAEQERGQLVIRSVDDILDYLDAIARRLLLNGIGRIPQEGEAMVDLAVRAVESLGRAIAAFSAGDGVRTVVMEAVSEVEAIRDDAAVLKRHAAARLFREITDIRQLLKTKEILELVERVIERCEQAGQLLPTFLHH